MLVETLDLAKLRAVDTEALGERGQYLPALYFAFNAKDDAVSTDFAPLTRQRQSRHRHSRTDPPHPSRTARSCRPSHRIRDRTRRIRRPHRDPPRTTASAAAPLPPPPATRRATPSITSWTRLEPHCRDADMRGPSARACSIRCGC